MSKLRKLLLPALVAALIIVIILTWGSVGSILCAFCLIIMVAALLYRRFVLDRDEDDFKMEL